MAGQNGPAPPNRPPLSGPGCEPPLMTISNNKFVTDNLNLMCEFECLLCGASLKVRRKIIAESSKSCQYCLFFKTLDPDSESGSRIPLNPDP